MASGTATTRHAQPPHLTNTQSLTSRLAIFMGFQPRHQHQHHPSPRTPPDHGLEHDPWIALPQPQASTSSFGAGTLRSLHTGDGGPYGVSAFSSEEGGASSYHHHQHQQHLQAPAVGAGLSPYLAAPNAFAKQQQQQMFNSQPAPPPPRSTSPWGGSGSSFSSPIEPAPGRGGFLQSLGRSASTREANHHHNQPTSLSASAPAPSTSKVSPLKQRLRTSGLFPTSSSVSPSKPSSGGGGSSASKKLHYMQASLAAFDGGIGESPVPSRKGKEKASYVVGGGAGAGAGASVVVKEKEKEKEREKIRKKEKESGMKFPSYYSATPPPATAPPQYGRDKRHSPLSPLMGFASSSHHQNPTIGKALGVRTSLLGFGTESPLGMWDTSSPVGAGRSAAGDPTEMFDKPRKAPLPPGHTPSPSNTSTSVVAEEESHSRKPSVEMGGMYAPGGPSTLGPVREESEGQMGTSQEGSGEGDGRQGERDEDRLSPAPQRRYVVVTPPPPQDDGLQEAIIVPLPPSASSHHTESSRQPSPTSTFPSPISPLSPNQIPPPLHSRGRNHQRTRTPNEGSSSTTQKPPIPPKSQETIRMAQGAKILKAYSSTPNLLVAAFGSAGAAGGSVNVSPSKGKGKERVHVDEALNTERSPSSAAPAPATGSRLAAQLQAQTICDALMFPKPRFVAHVISPPGTPEAFSAPSRPLHTDPSSSSTPRSPYVLPEIIPPPPLSLDKVLKEGEMRERERDRWAAKASRGLLSRNASTRSRSHTDASGGSLRGRNLSVTSASTGGGLVNRLRARTLSGRKGHGKGHKRGDSKETQQTQQTSEMGEIEGGGGARIGGRTGTLRGLKKEPSYEFDTVRQRQVAVAQARDSPTPATMTTSATKPVPLGKQGKLSISLTEKDLHQATVGVRAHTDSGGTVRSTHTTSNTTHSRKSSGQSRHMPFSSHPFASHSRSGSSGSVSAGAASAASYAIRKVKSLCGPERLSPAAEETAFVGGSREEKKSQVDPAAARPSVERRATVPRESLYEDRMMEALGDRPLPIVVPQRQVRVLDFEEEEEEDYGSGERHLVDPSYEVGVALGGESSAPASRRESAMAAGSHGTSPRTMRESLNAPSPSQPDTSSSHLDMEDGEDDETAQIHQVTNRVSMTPAQSRQSISAVGGPSPIDIPNIRPVPTPSPSPSSYHGVYGIAIGTPNFNHPFVLSSQDRISDIPNLPAGPHPTSPTYLQLPVSNDLVSRHRLPPHRAPLHPPPNIALPTPPVSSEHHGSNRNTADITDVPSEYDDEPSSLMPMYAPSSAATSPRRNAHPYAVHSPAPSLPRNYRMSVNSVEAMFGGELLESSHTVSPLGVREAGESWINSTDADLKGLSTPAEEDEYRHSGDSGLGSSTEIHSLQRSTQSRHTRSKPSRAATQSSSIGSMLIESPPPSMFPSFRQNRDSSMFDTMTFGPGDDFSIYEGDRSRPLSEIAPEPAPVSKPNAPESISSSSTSSVELQQRPLGSSDDLESFKDLFYVPRSRQPSASSPKFRRSEASGDSKIADPNLHEIEAYARSLPSSEALSRSSSARILSPLSSVLEMRQSFAPDLDSPYRAHSLEDPNETVHYSGYFPPRASVYDIMEEDESVHSVSSVERNTEEDVRFGTVNASAPYVTAGRLNRQSTQPSLFDDDSESPLPAVPRARPSFLDTDSSNPAYRASYMTTTSGTSLGNRMSHIISDFPTPPINNPSSSGFLDFYTGSQGVTPDTHSFSSTPQPLVPRPPIPFRTDSFGPQT
ncbi:hypothetical protein FRC04_002526 [Tulasnella sp. 424]|nr:hypothetical protein FRC04_002526 [Tulasnella sp. 424]KAG8966500.1 hypothetical protein FRC05_002640 [Tulasnella sp. 425]